MEHSSLLSANGSRTSDGQSSPAVLGPGTPDFRERFIQTMLQHHRNGAILDNAQLFYVLDRLRNQLSYVLDRLRNFATSVTSYAHEHPWETAFALLSILSILVVPVILPAIGFSALGPVAQSIAAAWQSSLGIVAAATPFAFLQSAAMGGAAAGVFYGAGVAGLAVLGGKKAVGWAIGWWNKE